MARTTASTASTHSDTYESGSERGEGGWGCKDSKVTGWAGLAPKTTFLGPASFSLAKQLNVGGRGQDEGEVQTPSLDLPLYIIYTASKEYFFATVGRNFWKCKFHNRATDRKIIIRRSVLKKRLLRGVYFGPCGAELIFWVHCGFTAEYVSGNKIPW